MRLQSLIVRSAALALGLGLLFPLASLAQTFAAGSAVQPVISTAPLDETHKLSPGHGRSDDPREMFGRVRDGVYTVDGMVAKLRMNYDLDGVKHLYLFVPGVGTAIVSTSREPKVVVTEATLTGNELTFAAGEHRFKLTGVALANNKGSAPEHLYVRLDPNSWQLSKRPMLGFGNAAEAPYQWPAALPAVPEEPMSAERKEIVPPVPVSLLPSPRPVKPATAPVATALSVSRPAAQ